MTFGLIQKLYSLKNYHHIETINQEISTYASLNEKEWRWITSDRLQGYFKFVIGFFIWKKWELY